MVRLAGIIGSCGVAGFFLLGGIVHAEEAAGGARPAPVTGLVPDHATLSVENIEREAEWYERVLGFKPFSKSTANPDFINWHLVIPGYRIDLVKWKGSTRAPAGDSPYLRQGWTHVVFHVENVAEAWKTLQALNIDVKVNKDGSGVPIQLLIHDPEGNEIEIRRNLVV